MNEKNLYQKVLKACLKTGGDFAEIYNENTIDNSIEMTSKTIKSVDTANVFGCGIRILKGLQEVYGYTNDTTEQGLMALATTLASNYTDEASNYEFTLEEVKYRNVINETEISKMNTSNSDKVEIMNILSDNAYSVSDKLVQVIVRYSDSTQNVTIANTNGKFTKGVRFTSRFALSCVAKENDRMESISDSIGGGYVLSEFYNKDLAGFAKNVAQSAVDLLHAEEMIGGVYDVVIHNAFGGVIFHEACGHSLEATSVAKNLSVFSNKLGEKIAADCVTAIDDGTIEDEWGSSAFDDEGTQTRKNVLIENGVLKSYMIDYRNSRRMNSSITGNSRRQNYRFSPTSRMTNTYIANGDSTYEEIIAKTKFGFFAEKMGGGSVNPVTGEYNFSVAKGYMIENGKLTTLVKGATLIGNGASTLLHVDMVADNQSFGYGMCGSASGSIPACVGQPTIRVKNMTVGGNGVKA